MQRGKISLLVLSLILSLGTTFNPAHPRFKPVFRGMPVTCDQMDAHVKWAVEKGIEAELDAKKCGLSVDPKCAAKYDLVEVFARYMIGFTMMKEDNCKGA